MNSLTVEQVEVSADPREQYERMQGHEVPVTPIPPVASQIVADLPAMDVPVLDSDAKRKPKGAK